MPETPAPESALDDASCDKCGHDFSDDENDPMLVCPDCKALCCFECCPAGAGTRCNDCEEMYEDNAMLRGPGS